QDMVDLNAPKGVARHVRESRLGEILDDRQTTASTNGEQASGSAIELTRQQHPDRPGAKFAGGRTKPRINRGPLTVFARAANNANVVALQRQMVVARSNVDVTGLDLFAVERVRGCDRRVATQNLGQAARSVRRRMDHDKNGSGKVGRELGQ